MRAFATQLRTQAGLLQRAVEGKPLLHQPRLLQKETAARQMLTAGGHLAAPEAATVAALLPALKALQTTMTDESGKCPVPDVNDAVAEWEYRLRPLF